MHCVFVCWLDELCLATPLARVLGRALARSGLSVNDSIIVMIWLTLMGTSAGGGVAVTCALGGRVCLCYWPRLLCDVARREALNEMKSSETVQFVALSRARVNLVYAARRSMTRLSPPPPPPSLSVSRSLCPLRAPVFAQREFWRICNACAAHSPQSRAKPEGPGGERSLANNFPLRNNCARRPANKTPAAHYMRGAGRTRGAQTTRELS